MANLVNIGKKIKLFRERAHLTQSQIAEFLSIDQSLVSKIEKGERNISEYMLEELATLFCCSVDSIISDDDSLIRSNIAFRKDAVEISDLRCISLLNKIVINQFEMDRLLKERTDDR